MGGQNIKYRNWRKEIYEGRRTLAVWKLLALIAVIIFLFSMFAAYQMFKAVPVVASPIILNRLIPSADKPHKTITAYVTFYTKESSCHFPDNFGLGLCQTASGQYGKEGVAACPRNIPFGTIIEIQGQRYICLDRYAQYLDKQRDYATYDLWFTGSNAEAIKKGISKEEVVVYQ